MAPSSVYPPLTWSSKLLAPYLLTLTLRPRQPEALYSLTDLFRGDIWHPLVFTPRHRASNKSCHPLTLTSWIQESNLILCPSVTPALSNQTPSDNHSLPIMICMTIPESTELIESLNIYTVLGFWNNGPHSWAVTNRFVLKSHLRRRFMTVYALSALSICLHLWAARSSTRPLNYKRFTPT